MTDDHVADDQPETTETPVVPVVSSGLPPTEGVRILGAQEAAAIDAQRDADAPPAIWTESGPSWSATEHAPTGDEPTGDAAPDDDAPGFGVGADADVTQALPVIDAEWESDTAAVPETVADVASTGEVPALQHWSEPPTGQIPAILATSVEPEPTVDVGAGAPEGDDADVWASLSGPQPRFRAEGDDWSDADFREALVGDDDIVAIGADREPVFDVTEDSDAFVAAVRARRRAGTRAVVTSTPTPRAEEGAGAGRRAGRRSDTTPGDDDLAEAVAAPGAGRDLRAAVTTGVVFGAVALACFWLGPVTSALLAAVVVGACAFELCAALQSKGLRPATIPVITASAAAPLVMLRANDVSDRASAAAGLAPMAVLFLLVTVVSMLWFLFRAGPGRAVVGVATSLLAFAYVGGLGGYAGLLLQRGSHGVRLLLSTILCVVAYDVFGYFVGRQFGTNKIAPDVSPNKTVEGTLAGVGGAIIVAMVFVSRICDWPAASSHGLVQFACVGFVLGVATLLGDLCESLLKRDLGIKDLGSVLPGHGGFLDRFDGLLFALPVMYFVSLGLNLF